MGHVQENLGKDLQKLEYIRRFPQRDDGNGRSTSAASDGGDGGSL